jgi:head-tail adaptor
MTGRGHDEVGEHFEAIEARFRVRAAHQIEAGWRVAEEGGHTYCVRATEPNRRRGFIMLICEKLNV